MIRIMCACLTAIVAAVFAAGTAGAADLPPCFGNVSFVAQPISWSPEVSADFGALLAKLGEKGDLDPASVRVTTDKDELLPTKFLADAKAPGRGVVRWVAPGNKDDQVSFRIYFAAKSGKTWGPTEAEKVGAANLIYNGSFEVADASGKRPAEWTRIAAAGCELVMDTQSAHSGNGVVKMTPATVEGKPIEPHIQTPGRPNSNIEAGKTYRFSYWMRSQDAGEGLVCAAQAYWYKANGDYLLHVGFEPALKKGTSGWEQATLEMAAPAEAKFVMFYPTFYSNQGSLFLDDFVIAPAKWPELTSAQSADGSRKVTLDAK